MSIQDYPLYEFVTRVPSCYDTTPVKKVLSIFDREQHYQQLVVNNEQQIPLGLLNSTNLLAQIIYREQDELGNTEKFDWSQPISSFDFGLMMRIVSIDVVLMMRNHVSNDGGMMIKNGSDDFGMIRNVSNDGGMMVTNGSDGDDLDDGMMME